jgi:hypothetical protein
MALLWKFLLAAALPVDYDLTQLPYPIFCSPKIDGVRGGIQNGVVVGRKGLAPRNPAVQELVTHEDMEGLDFEITVGPPWAADVFARTNGCCNSAKPEAVEEFRKHGRFHIIDGADAHSTFAKRRAKLRRAVKSYGPRVHVIEQELIKTAIELRAYESVALELGYEGVMLKRGDSGDYPQKPGKDNRSTLKEFYLVKWKRFEYADAVIVAAHTLEHNANTTKTAAGKRSNAKAGMVKDARGWVGSVTLQDVKSKQVFEMTVQRHELQGWAGWQNEKLWKGKRVRYKYQAYGMKDKARIGSCEFKELVK